MLPDRVSNPGPLTYKSGALPIALRSPAIWVVHLPKQTETGSTTYYILLDCLGHAQLQLQILSHLKVAGYSVMFCCHFYKKEFL